MKIELGMFSGIPSSILLKKDNTLWESGDDNMLKLFFGRKLYFWRQLEIELTKLSNPHIYDEKENVQHGTRELKELSLYEIRQTDPGYEKNLRDTVFERSKDIKGSYTCAFCGKKGTSRVFFQIDHIKPMNQGGNTVLSNLQVLCRQCNGKKGDS